MDWRAVTDTIMGTCRNTFGETIIYQPKVGPPFQLRGIFEDATSYRDIDSVVDLEGSTALVDFLTDDLTFKPLRSDTVLIKRTGKVYKMLKCEYDGFSRTRCWLKDLAE